MSTPANIITARLLIEIPAQFPGIRVWRNNRVDVMAAGSGGRMRRVQAGVDGQADITGIIKPSGKRLEIEVKAGKDRQSAAQVSYDAMIQDHGGIYLVARSVEQCLEDLRYVLCGLP
jgi:hypothetical protein